MVNRLSNGDITKHEAIYEINYMEAINLMTLWALQDRAAEKAHRAASRKK